jgi:hypothetical protein
MRNADVVRGAVSVGATAAAVAVVFGLPTLLSILGVHVDYAIVANMLAALGALPRVRSPCGLLLAIGRSGSGSGKPVTSPRQNW